MRKLLLIIFLCFSLTSIETIFGQDRFTVSVTVEFSGAEGIYVCLYDQTSYPTWRKELPPPGFVLTKKCDSSGKASFVFGEVPRGEYVILAFVDKNGNGKLDSDAWGFLIEPFITYKPAKDITHFPMWHDRKFTVDKDQSGIVMKF
jgi:uncharacterized protein (DUF2141 family)